MMKLIPLFIAYALLMAAVVLILALFDWWDKKKNEKAYSKFISLKPENILANLTPADQQEYGITVKESSYSGKIPSRMIPPTPFPLRCYYENTEAKKKLEVVMFSLKTIVKTPEGKTSPS
jgi:hypothetical protein